MGSTELSRQVLPVRVASRATSTRTTGHAHGEFHGGGNRQRNVEAEMDAPSPKPPPARVSHVHRQPSNRHEALCFKAGLTSTAEPLENVFARQDSSACWLVATRLR